MAILRLPFVEPDASNAGEISSQRLTQIVEPMRLDRRRVNGEMRLVFGESVRFDADVAPRRLATKDGSWRRIRLEYRTTDVSLEGWSLAYAFLPYECQLVDVASIKKPDKKNRAWITNRIDRPQDVKSFLEERAADPFEGRSGFLIGAITEVPPTLSTTERQPRTPEVCLGLTADVRADVDELRSRDPDIHELETLTSRRTIKFGQPGTKLFPDLVDEALSALDVSCMQALAGPRDNATHAGAPVAELVKTIYRGHLNNLNRRRSAELRRSERRTDDAS